MTSSTCLSLFQEQLALWSDLTWKAGEMLAASAQVIGHRTGRMAVAGVQPSARDRREFALMGQEKLDAAAASAAAMGSQWFAFGNAAALQAWRDALAATDAALALASSRSVQESVERQAALARTLGRSAASAGRLGTAGAHIAGRGLAPIHAAATANARRLARKG